MTLTQGWDRVARLRACGGCRYRRRIERAGRNCVGPREALLRQRRLDVDLPIDVVHNFFEPRPAGFTSDSFIIFPDPAAPASKPLPRVAALGRESH